MPQRISGPKIEKNMTDHKSTSFGAVCFSIPESFITEVAGDDNSFEMVCFNVIFDGTAHAFLSTNFAPMS